MLVLAAAHAKPDCSAVHGHNHSSGFAMFRSDNVHLVVADPTWLQESCCISMTTWSAKRKDQAVHIHSSVVLAKVLVT